jgi:ribosomal protein S12 methylthiotransferase
MRGKQRVHVITMGCAKNLVDSEKLMAQLRRNNVLVAGSPEDADIAIVNTCGFIEAAREESVGMIMDQVRYKRAGRLKKVYALGCLTERYRDELKREIPELDGVFGSNGDPGFLHALVGTPRDELPGERVLTTPSHYAYLKISEGCDHPCSFCAIPLMRGNYASRPSEDILREAKMLADQGVKELIVIGQDTTTYGVDLGGKPLIAALLERIAETPGIEWVRLMYAYPSRFPMEILRLLAKHPRMCKYLDLPVQHSADNILRSMQRGTSRRNLLELLHAIVSLVPGIALRTTLIVGYPGETEKEFEDLVAFVQEMRFSRLGVFTYSREEGTSAWSLGDPVPQPEKERRRSVIMEKQKEISDERNASLIGSKVRVLVDRMEGNFAIGRTECDAPEIDNEVYISNGSLLAPGIFCDVEIHDATEYDLYGRL